MTTFRFRPGTSDRGIFIMAVVRNEYRLPRTLAPNDVVLDVGAHIGSFSVAALRRGTRRVYAVEAGEENFRLARENLQPFIDRGEVELTHAAVWRSDANDDELRFTPGPCLTGFPGLDGIVNTGGGSVLWPGGGAPAAKMPLDELVLRATADGGRIRLLKLDCEGAEWPILFTSRTLHLVDEICGEFHEIGGELPGVVEGHDPASAVFCGTRTGGYLAGDLVMLLRDAGFEVTSHRHRRPDGTPEGLGLFFARRPELSTSDRLRDSAAAVTSREDEDAYEAEIVDCH